MFKKLMKKILFLGFLFLTIYGCKSPIADDIIQPNKMGDILYDIHLADAYTNTMSNQDSAKRVASSYYYGIYKKFGIDSAAYTKSMDFYYENPEIMAQLYETIQAKLKKTKDKAEKAQELKLKLATDKKKKLDSLSADSLKKINLKKAGLKDSVAIKKKDSIAKVKKAALKKIRIKKARELKDVNNKPILK
ncbi:DUF4296 domain-containing protein [Pedobacter sp. CG_S7]|uniref:DUF4296 domain-containing protein n=1 Tax=Pedobacter sp. CG_S7 TaxID=3143930 RepID=UPI00339AC430